MPKDNKPKYKEEKATRVRLDEDTEYIAVILDEDSSFGVDVGASLPGGANVGLEKGKKKKVLATYVKDKSYGLLPEDVWKEQKKNQVAGTLSPYANTVFTIEDITVTSGIRTIAWSNCPKCKEMIVSRSRFCRNCGADLKPI